MNYLRSDSFATAVVVSGSIFLKGFPLPFGLGLFVRVCEESMGTKGTVSFAELDSVR